LGIGDWGLGNGDWGVGAIPNRQSPIPNPHLFNTYKTNKTIYYLLILFYKLKFIYINKNKLF